MRPKILVLSFVLLSLACNTDVAAPGELQGTWSADLNLPGASLVLDIVQNDGTIAGGGTYAIEAGRAGTLQVSGTYARPDISLTIARDFGLRQVFAGTVLDSRHMAGTITDEAGHSSPLSFTRR
jgi:hypothetical protein